jgi:hypothetical protein
MRLVSRTGLIATAVAIGVIAAPAASADPSHSGWNPPPSWVVRANPDHQAAELAGPATAHKYSLARIVGRNSDQQVQAYAATTTGSHLICVPRSDRCSTVSNTPATTAQPDPGFQYDDAVIGAGVMTGVLLLGAAGTLAVRRRNEVPHP